MVCVMILGTKFVSHALRTVVKLTTTTTPTTTRVLAVANVLVSFGLGSVVSTVFAECQPASDYVVNEVVILILFLCYGDYALTNTIVFVVKILWRKKEFSNTSQKHKDMNTPISAIVEYVWVVLFSLITYVTLLASPRGASSLQWVSMVLLITGILTGITKVYSMITVFYDPTSEAGEDSTDGKFVDNNPTSITLSGEPHQIASAPSAAKLPMSKISEVETPVPVSIFKLQKMTKDTDGVKNAEERAVGQLKNTAEAPSVDPQITTAAVRASFFTNSGPPAFSGGGKNQRYKS